MPVIPCPNCGQRVSSRAAICGNCGHELGDASEEDRKRFRRRKLRNQLYRLNMASYAIMAAVIAAFGWYWIGTDGFQAPVSTNGPYYLMAASAVAYLAVRALQFRLRRQKKENRRSA